MAAPRAETVAEDPVAKSGDYKSIAARYAAAKALKEKEDAEKERVKRVQESAEKMDGGKAKEREMQKGVLRRSWNWVVGFWVWILLIHATGIYFFTKGFLLTRLVLDSKSSCSEAPIALTSTWDGVGTPDGGCWHPKTFDKAVVMIVDALRYDFTVPFNSSSGASPLACHDALPFLHDTAVNDPNKAFLLPFIADPPTSTLQRLKGLTTGTLPTFVDVGSNFAGTAIEEDNLLMQLKDAGRRIVHLGDDTWTALFPGYFEEGLSRAYDSFNVWDLHTVDDGVTEHIMPLLGEQGRGKWDILVAHYLGVDHAGHRYGPDHPAMTAKLKQMDGVLQQIVSALDDDTLLVVMGDHGMDAKGDHGGESDDEVEAALWMYSKKGIFGRTESRFVMPPRTAKERPVSQIDLVPTLALLLGLPIPFNNLGKPIEEAFIGSAGSAWNNLAAVGRITAAAIKRYQTAYYEARGIEQSSLGGSPKALWEEADREFQSQSNGQVLHQKMSLYQEETLRICRGLWARFDVPSMIQGIAILAAGVLVLLVYARDVVDDEDAVLDTELDRAEKLLERSGIGNKAAKQDAAEDFTQSIVTGAFIGSLAGGSLGLTASQMAVDASQINEALLGAAAGGFLGVFAAQLGSLNKFRSPLPQSLWGWLAVIFTISQSVGFASNSYTIWEDSILLFFISTFGILAALSCLRKSTAAERSLGILQSAIFVILGWITSFSRLCREEQMPFCRSTYYASATSSTSAPWQLLIPFAVALLLPTVVKSYYVSTRSYEGLAPLWINVAFRNGLLASAIFWTLDTADDGEWFPSIAKGTLKSIRVVIALTIFGVALGAGTIAFSYAPPCVAIKTTVKSPSATSSNGNTAPKATITVLGYANVYGTHYFLLYLNIALCALLVQKPMGAGSLALLTFQILSLLEILDTLSLSSSAIGPIALALLGSFHFFKTGHQATLSSIQWETAFIPLSTIRYPWSPLLVILNTFGSHILTATAVPLTVLWKIEPRQDVRGLMKRLARAWAWYVLYFAVEALATTMWAGWLRRHLMLYRIFSPRFMVGAAALLVVDVAALAIVWVAVRANGEVVLGWA